MLAAIVCGAEIGIGDAREEVLRQLGKPTSVAIRGDHEILLYPGGGRVEIIEGKVADLKGPLPAVAPALEPTALAPPAVTNEAAVAPAKPAVPDPVLAVAAPEPGEDVSYEYNPAIAANELAKHVEKMDTAWGASPQMEPLHAPLDSIPAFITGLLLRFVITLVALKLAFRYWEMDAFWIGTFFIAGIDITLHAILELLGPATSGLSMLFAVEYGIPGLVMIYTIHRFCFNKRIQNAVLTATAVKLVVMIIYVVVGVAALNMVYG